MIQVTELTKKYGNTTVVDHLSFSVERGEVLGFLGLNGAGKSTTMKMIAGFLKPDHGFVEIDGVNVEQNPIVAKSKLGYLPEGIALYGDMPVHSYLAFVARARGLRRKDVVEKIASVVRVLEIKDVLSQKISTLSKGFLRRVGLAQSLLHDPDYLVLDEPTEGLDPKQREQVRQLIERLAESKVIILSTHILEEVETLCDRVIIIDKGQLIVDKRLDSLLQMSEFNKSIRLRISNAGSKDVEAKLRQIEQVSNVLYDVDDDSFRLISKDAESLLDRVWVLADQNNWRVNKLVQESGDLEQVFLELTSEEQRKSR